MDEHTPRYRPQELVAFAAGQSDLDFHAVVRQALDHGSGGPAAVAAGPGDVVIDVLRTAPGIKKDGLAFCLSLNSLPITGIWIRRERTRHGAETQNRAGGPDGQCFFHSFLPRAHSLRSD